MRGRWTTRRLSEVDFKNEPACPTCANLMRHYGGTRGYECCEWKLLYKAGGWTDADGKPRKDRRISA